MKQGQTITEKIFSKHSSKKVYAGDYVVANLDLVMAHDTTCAWALEPFYKMADKVWDCKKIFIPFDHAYPSPNVQMSELQASIRKFAKEQGIEISTDGVCHQLLAERFIKPGGLFLGADSHTPTGGALGAVTIGVGSTDAAIAMATGKCWFMVPETIRININGKRPKNVYAKDIILKIAQKMKTGRAVYKTVEFGGEVVRKMEITERLTLTNMAAELGAKAAIVEPDQRTLKFLKEQKRSLKKRYDFKKWWSDSDCEYDQVIEIDTSKLKPLVAVPHDIDQVHEAKVLKKKKIKLDQIFIGSCTNGRLEDLKITYETWCGKKLNPETRVIITPASKKIFEEALEKGYIQYFMKLGATVTNASCGACLGRQGGVLADNEVCLATSNRNFQGRMGSPEAKVYLSSPRTAAKSAIMGYITD
jgi:3-isopropylmalate/(R)-2-methylmalate dehydratase large subunit